MNTIPKCILITGMGHTGTRLVEDMFARHPEVSVPLSILNRSKEFPPLHKFFINSMDITPMDSDNYMIDESGLRIIIEDYLQHIEKQKKNFILKMPYYPLNCLDFFLNYFNGNISFVYVTRPKEKIINSFVRRNQDKTLFNNPKELSRQLKKLNVKQRNECANCKNATLILEEQIKYCDLKRQDWDKNYPNARFIEINVESWVTSREYVFEILGTLNLTTDSIDDIMSIADKNRLLEGKQKIIKSLHRIVRNFLPNV